MVFHSKGQTIELINNGMHKIGRTHTLHELYLFFLFHISYTCTIRNGVRFKYGAVYRVVPIGDFTHIIGMTGWLFGTAVKADSPLKSWQDLLAYARANPGRLTYSTSGIGTTNHLAMETIQEIEKISLTHVPFRGANEGVTAVLSGQVDMICDSSTWAPNVEAGQMRALAVWSAERAPRFPNIPTLKELGYDLVVASPYGVSGPKGMDPGIVRVLHDAMKDALFSPENTRIRSQFDMPLVYQDTEAYRRFIVERVEYEKTMVRRLGLTLDG